MIGKRKLTKQDKELLACFNHDAPSDLVFWSFRYFLGRMTIHACCFADQLATCWPHLDARVQALIKRELEKEFERLDEHIAQLKKNKKKLQKHQKTDLAEAIIDRDALKQAHNYYGGDDV